MAKILKFLLVQLVVLVSANAVFAQVTGTVFKDFNFDGVRQTTGNRIEDGAYGIVVRAYNSSNALLATKTSDFNGAYAFAAAEIPSGTAVRLEFTEPTGQFSARVATGNASSNIQFITAGAAAVANFAVTAEHWYSSSDNPYLATNGYTNGDHAGSGTAASNNNLYVFPWLMGDGTPDDGGTTRRLPNSQLGAIFGLTYQHTTRTLLMSAYVKRHISLGNNGIGAIYKTTVSATGVPAAASLLVDLEALGFDFGNVDRSGAQALPANSATRNTDANAFAKVGKEGIGGIDLSDDGANLFVMNMFDKKLYKVNVGNPVKATIAASDVSSFTIAGPSGSLNWRPMAVKYYNGAVYVGGVYVKEQTTPFAFADTAGQRIVVYRVDPNTGAATEVMRHNMTYRRGYSNGELRYPLRNNFWCSWQDDGSLASLTAGYNTTGAGANNGGIYYPQPMLADIDFDTDGSMILGVRDRFGDQIGYQNVSTDGLPQFGFGGSMATPTTSFFRGLTSADVLRAGANFNGTFTMESGASTTSFGQTRTTAGTPSNNRVNGGDWNGTGTGAVWPYAGFHGPDWGGTAATPNPYTGGTPTTINQGTQGAYFYFDHNFVNGGTAAGGTGVWPATMNNRGLAGIDAHFLKAEGGLATLAGSGQVAVTAMDPVSAAFENGVLRFSNTTGTLQQRLTLSVTVTTPTPNPANMGKANAVGDLELLTDEQPIQIGNRVWIDTNGNGIQDAGENGINGVAVKLFQPGTDGLFNTADDVELAATTTGANGEYYFTTLTVEDSRRPAAFVGLPANSILPNTNYQVRIENAVATGSNTQQTALAGYNGTKTNIANNASDLIDNDGIIQGANAVAIINTANNNHSIDFGFKTTASLGNKVWRDDNKDGSQDPEEPGVAGVTVSLFRGTTFVRSTVTDAYGFYLFDELTPSTTGDATTNYNVEFTLPANYTFTNQSNTQNPAGTVTTASGVSTAASGSDANITTGKTGGFFLANGAAERGVDAGIVFNTPASKSSIGDRVWLDRDANGNQGTVATEPGIAGVTVTLLKETTPGSGVYTTFMVTKTDADGNYLFNDLPNGTNYQVRITPPVGSVITPTTGTLSTGDASTNSDFNGTTFTTPVINIPAGGANYRGVDAGIVLQADNKCAIGDRVWHDLNQNGIQDAGEPGIEGVVVTLTTGTAGAETVVGTRTTDAFGYYVFNDLNPGNYRLTFPTSVPSVQSTTLGITGANAANNDAFDNDADIVTGRTMGYTLTAGERNMSVDAGYYNKSGAGARGALGDRVWNDLNRDGLQTPGEVGVAGIKVTLLDNTGAVVATTYTDENGNYLFPNLTPGSYTVKFENLPAGFTFTSSKTGMDNALDSDVNRATGISLPATVTAGTTNTTVDCGIFQGTNSGLGTLGNRVWYDLRTATNNGKQDSDETGVSGVTVELYLDANGNGVIDAAEQTPVQTTTTNTLGEYIFKGLNAGNYQVGFSNLPAGFTLTTTDASGVADAEDSDGNALNTAVAGNPAVIGKSYTGLVALAQGEDNLTVDLGIVPAVNTNTLGDKVWFDTNKNGTQDANEPGVPGVVVTLLDNTGAVIRTTTTDSKGQYLFVGLPDGNYSVRFSQLPNGFDYTTKSATNTATGSDADNFTGATTQVTLNASNRNDRSLDAGLVTDKAALGNYVWFDNNRDGKQDTNEPPVPGATVTLYRPGFGLDGNPATTADNNLPVATAITNGEGFYFFPNLEPGTYEVEFTTKPDNTIFTKQDDVTVSTDTDDSDVNPTTGRTGSYTLAASQVNLTVDAGVAVPRYAQLGNRVWADLNRDGDQDSNEPGVAGVEVTLFDASNNRVASAITDGNGYYLLTDLPSGTGFYVVFNANITGFTTATAPTGAQIGFTSQNVGANGTGSLDAATESDTDSDVLQTGVNAGRTATFNIVDGANYPNIDAGIIVPANFVVPIQLTNFTAVAGANQTANVNWTVGIETGILSYELQHSTNGVNYATVATQSANGSRTYNSVHNAAPQANYYRLKVVEANGTVSYSAIKLVNFGKNMGDVKVYPVPAVDVLSILLPTASQGKNVQIQLIANDGKVVAQQIVANAPNKIDINVANVASGQYYVQIVSGNEIITKKVTITR
jgi:protocatechuate 3,4-dioxygenase beta subunit